MMVAVGAAELGVRLLAPRDPAPAPAEVDAAAYFSPQEIERGHRYSRSQLRIALLGTGLELIALGSVVSRLKTHGASTRDRDPQVARGALAGAALAGGGTLLALPLSALARRRAIAVGLVTQSWRGWAVDLAKTTAIESGLAAGAGGGAIALTRRYPRGWWLPAAAGMVSFGALFGALAPVLLAPLFNDFTPLPDGPTRSDVLELTRAAGVDVGEVYSVDASRRTTGANAYVTGLGPTKRVVLFDTLLERYDRDQVRVVVAHELAHVRHRDVLRSVLYAAIVAPAAALATQRLSWALSAARATPEALPALALAAALVAGPTGLIGNRLSRAVERRADAFSLELSGSPDAFISFHRAVALQNVADVTPPRWATALLATHPPTLERIGTAVAYAPRPA